MRVSESLINKYNVPVPRYTSYPPANHFTHEMTREKHQRMVVDSNDGQPEHMAFYIHIPFCKKICFYCGCNACTLGKAELLVPYLEALKREISEVTPLLDKNRKLTQIHYGGGTPNAIPARYIGEINELLFSAFDFTDNPEIAIECHPAYLDDDYINDLARYGFNRFSLGIQDLDNKVLEMVNREAPREPLPDLINKIKSAGKAMSVNLDFIYGLPGQHVDGFSRTISQAIEMKPDRLVTFSYAHVPWLKKHQNILEKRGLPGPKEKIDIFLAAWELLLSSGYHSIGLDHYVRKEDELYTALRHNKLHRNFQGYCTRSTTGQVYAFGASSITQLEKGYIQNVKGVKEYIQQLKETGSAAVKGLELTPNQVIVREAITDLMCNKKVQWENTAARINISAEELLQVIELDQEALNEFEADGLMKMDANGIKLTESGSLFIRNIAASLDPAFRSETQNYSKSV